MNIANLFKNYVYSTHLNLNNQVIEDFTYQLEANSCGRLMSNVGGYQSNDVLNADLEELSKLKYHIIKAGDHIRRSYRLTNPVKLSRIWCNINRYKDYNKQHTHRDSLFSGVYYINLPEDSGIVFVHPSPVYGFSWGNAEFDTGSFSDGYCYKPKVGELLVFPSWLVHYVPSNMSDVNRVSISFDLV